MNKEPLTKERVTPIKSGDIIAVLLRDRRILEFVVQHTSGDNPQGQEANVSKSGVADAAADVAAQDENLKPCDVSLPETPSSPTSKLEMRKVPDSSQEYQAPNIAAADATTATPSAKAATATNADVIAADAVITATTNADAVNADTAATVAPNADIANADTAATADIANADAVATQVAATVALTTTTANADAVNADTAATVAPTADIANADTAATEVATTTTANADALATQVATTDVATTTTANADAVNIDSATTAGTNADAAACDAKPVVNEKKSGGWITYFLGGSNRSPSTTVCNTDGAERVEQIEYPDIDTDPEDERSPDDDVDGDETDAENIHLAPHVTSSFFTSMDRIPNLARTLQLPVLTVKVVGLLGEGTSTLINRLCGLNLIPRRSSSMMGSRSTKCLVRVKFRREAKFKCTVALHERGRDLPLSLKKTNISSVKDVISKMMEDKVVGVASHEIVVEIHSKHSPILDMVDIPGPYLNEKESWDVMKDAILDNWRDSILVVARDAAKDLANNGAITLLKQVNKDLDELLLEHTIGALTKFDTWSIDCDGNVKAAEEMIRRKLLGKESSNPDVDLPLKNKWFGLSSKGDTIDSMMGNEKSFFSSHSKPVFKDFNDGGWKQLGMESLIGKVSFMLNEFIRDKYVQPICDHLEKMTVDKEIYNSCLGLPILNDGQVMEISKLKKELYPDHSADSWTVLSGDEKNSNLKALLVERCREVWPVFLHLQRESDASKALDEYAKLVSEIHGDVSLRTKTHLLDYSKVDDAKNKLIESLEKIVEKLYDLGVSEVLRDDFVKAVIGNVDVESSKAYYRDHCNAMSFESFLGAFKSKSDVQASLVNFSRFPNLLKKLEENFRKELEAASMAFKQEAEKQLMEIKKAYPSPLVRLDVLHKDAADGSISACSFAMDPFVGALHRRFMLVWIETMHDCMHRLSFVDSIDIDKDKIIESEEVSSARGKCLTDITTMLEVIKEGVTLLGLGKE